MNVKGPIYNRTPIIAIQRPLCLIGGPGYFFKHSLHGSSFFKPHDHARGGQDSQQGIIKKEQETIFEISIGSLHHFNISLKVGCRHTPVLSNDP
jgi:hypothetical protein